MLSTPDNHYLITQPMTEMAVARAFFASLKARNIAYESLLSKYQLPVLTPINQGGLVPIVGLWGLLNELAKREGVYDFGLTAFKYFEPSFREFMKGKKTLPNILNSFFSSAENLSITARFWLEWSDGDAWLCRAGFGHSDVDNGQDYVEQFALQILVQLVRQSEGEYWVPKKVKCRCAKDTAFSGHPVFTDANIFVSQNISAISLPTEAMPSAIVKNLQNSIITISENEARNQIISPFSSNVIKQVIRSYFLEKNFTLDFLAGLIGVSRRKLQRFLQQEGISFQSLLDDVRSESACDLLRTKRYSVTSVAVLMGYHQATNFTRSFKKWLGVTPLQYQKQNHGL